MTATIERLPLPASDVKDLGDILLAAKSNIQVAKAAFDRLGDVGASRMMIAPLNFISIGIEMLAAERIRDAAARRIASELPTAAQFGQAMYEASGLHVTPFEELHEHQRAYYTVCGAAVLKLMTEARA